MERRLYVYYRVPQAQLPATVAAVRQVQPALVLGDEPHFGSVPMEMMDLVLHPASQQLTVNPASPYVPVALAK